LSVEQGSAPGVGMSEESIARVCVRVLRKLKVRSYETMVGDQNQTAKWGWLGGQSPQGRKLQRLLCFPKNEVLKFRELDRCLEEEQRYDEKGKRRAR
jgi:hypothetical protein